MYSITNASYRKRKNHKIRFQIIVCRIGAELHILPIGLDDEFLFSEPQLAGLKPLRSAPRRTIAQNYAGLLLTVDFVIRIIPMNDAMNLAFPAKRLQPGQKFLLQLHYQV